MLLEFRNRISNSLDPDQAQQQTTCRQIDYTLKKILLICHHFLGPDNLFTIQKIGVLLLKLFDVIVE